MLACHSITLRSQYVVDLQLRRTLFGVPQDPRKGSTKQFKLGLVWLRNDLRLHDHEPFVTAAQQCEMVLPLYCFDPREYQVKVSHMPKILY